MPIDNYCNLAGCELRLYLRIERIRIEKDTIKVWLLYYSTRAHLLSCIPRLNHNNITIP